MQRWLRCSFAVWHGTGARLTLRAVPRAAIVNGDAGALVVINGRPFAAVAFTVAQGRIAEIDLVANPRKLPSVYGLDS